MTFGRLRFLGNWTWKGEELRGRRDKACYIRTQLSSIIWRWICEMIGTNYKPNSLSDSDNLYTTDEQIFLATTLYSAVQPQGYFVSPWTRSILLFIMPCMSPFALHAVLLSRIFNIRQLSPCPWSRVWNQAPMCGLDLIKIYVSYGRASGEFRNTFCSDPILTSHSSWTPQTKLY